MPHYFFHVRDGERVSRDSEGQDLPDLETARREALSAARELVGERLLHGGRMDESDIEIADESGTVLSVVNSAAALYRDGHFVSFGDDVTKSAPVFKAAFSKHPRE